MGSKILELYIAHHTMVFVKSPKSEYSLPSRLITSTPLFFQFICHYIWFWQEHPELYRISPSLIRSVVGLASININYTDENPIWLDLRDYWSIWGSINRHHQYRWPVTAKTPKRAAPSRSTPLHHYMYRIVNYTT